MAHSILQYFWCFLLVLAIGFIGSSIIQRRNMSPDQRRRAREEMHLDDHPFG